MTSSPSLQADAIAANDQDVLERNKTYFDEIAIETPGNGTRLMNSTRIVPPSISPSAKPRRSSLVGQLRRENHHIYWPAVILLVAGYNSA